MKKRKKDLKKKRTEKREKTESLEKKKRKTEKKDRRKKTAKKRKRMKRKNRMPYLFFKQVQINQHTLLVHTKYTRVKLFFYTSINDRLTQKDGELAERVNK